MMKVLHDLYMEYVDDEEFTDFISDNDIGVPLAVVTVQGFSVPTTRGVEAIRESFEVLCQYLEVDPEAPWSGLEQMLAASRGE